MTGSRPEDVSSLAATSGWDDERLAAAFAGSSARVIVPVDLAAVTVERLRPAAHPVPWWRRVLPAAAIALLFVVVIGGGFAILGGSSGLLWGGDEDAVAFREGPTPDLRTLDAGSFALDFPADWHSYDATGPYQGTALAVLSSMPIPCGDGERLDITCVYERPLEPGEARIIVGQEAYRESTVVDRPDVENATTTRTTLGGMPAIVDTFDVESEGDFYAADAHVRWSIAMPESLSHVVVLDAMVREPGLPEAQLASHSMIESFRFTPPPAPPSVEPTATVSPSVEPSPTPTPTPSTLPSPSAPGWGPWPPDGATVIELPTNDERIPRVAVVDRSGELTEVRAPTAVDGSPEGPSEGFYRDPTDASQYRLRWTTTICDREMLITIEEDIARIVIEHAPRDGCDAMAVGRELVFEFSRDVDPAEVELVAHPAVLLPEPNPDDLAGLEVIDVQGALAIRALPQDDRTIAVRGWYRLSNVIYDCFVPDTPEPALWPGCVGPQDRLLTEPVEETGLGFDGVGFAVWLDPNGDMSLLSRSDPVEVVVIGHFDDGMAEDCSAPLRQACRDVFVVEAIHPVPEGTLTNPRACGRRIDCSGIVFGAIDRLPGVVDEADLPLQTPRRSGSVGRLVRDAAAGQGHEDAAGQIHPE